MHLRDGHSPKMFLTEMIPKSSTTLPDGHCQEYYFAGLTRHENPGVNSASELSYLPTSLMLSGKTL